MKELFYVGLSNSNGYLWHVFLSESKNARSERSGFIAVGTGYEFRKDAENEAKVLNLSMFGIDGFGN